MNGIQGSRNRKERARGRLGMKYVSHSITFCTKFLEGKVKHDT